MAVETLSALIIEPRILTTAQRIYCHHRVVSTQALEVTHAVHMTVLKENSLKLYVTSVCCHSVSGVLHDHRHAHDHSCSKLMNEATDTVSKTAQLVNQILASKPTVVKKCGVGARSSKTAAKVALMKMKQHAQGDLGCPETERVYLRVYPPCQCKKDPQPMFFSKAWSVGRTVDSIASRLAIQNNNNVHLAKKLRLFTAEEGTILRTDCDIESFMKQELVFSGSSVVLEFVQNDSEKLEDLSVYNIS